MEGQKGHLAVAKKQQAAITKLEHTKADQRNRVEALEQEANTEMNKVMLK